MLKASYLRQMIIKKHNMIVENRKRLEMLGIEPRTSRMRSERSTPELHPPCHSTNNSRLNSSMLRVERASIFQSKRFFRLKRPLPLAFGTAGLRIVEQDQFAELMLLALEEVFTYEAPVGAVLEPICWHLHDVLWGELLFHRDMRF